jgi:hypothetical protein
MDMRDQSGNYSAWQLTQEGLDSLLAAFDEDRDEAACRYDRLRTRLIFFFSRRQAVDAESLADEVLDRMARRINEGERIELPESYAYGVARFVAREQERRAMREDTAKKAYIENALLAIDTPDERMLQDAMEQCLARHSSAEREVLTRYYTARGQEKIERRRKLAAELQLTQAGLRKYTFRLRRRIEDCVRARFAGKAEMKRDE